MSRGVDGHLSGSGFVTFASVTGAYEALNHGNYKSHWIHVRRVDARTAFHKKSPQDSELTKGSIDERGRNQKEPFELENEEKGRQSSNIASARSEETRVEEGTDQVHEASTAERYGPDMKRRPDTGGTGETEIEPATVLGIKKDDGNQGGERKER